MTRIDKTARRALGWLVLLLVLLATQPAFAVFYRDASPQGNVGISRPPIQQQIYLGPGERIKAARLFLDGNRVEPTWNADGLVSYVPPVPLAAGTHQARLIVEIAAASDRLVYDPLVSEFAFTVSAGAVEMVPQPGPEELRALATVNAYRRAAGQDPMRYSPALGAAAAAHARFLVDNPGQKDVDAHGETARWPGFTGHTVLDRTQYWGYGGNPVEVINFTDRAEAAVDGWMETLYHRIPLLHPGNRELGYGLAADGGALVNVLDAGPLETLGGAVVWPYPNQTGVPTGWDGLESPDPFRLYPGVSLPVGYTITLTFGSNVRSLTLGSWSLTGPEGAVKALAFSPENDEHLRDTVALIPTAPLAPGARYTVTMSGMLDGQPYTRTWSFTTADEHLPSPRRMTMTTRGGVLSRVTVEGSGFGQGLAAFLGGLPVRNLTVQSTGLLAFEPPLGLAGGAAVDLLLVTPAGREARWENFLEAGSVAFPEGGGSFTPLPLLVHGAPFAVSALQAPGGQVLLPAAALTELGAVRTERPEIGRNYWTWGGRQGDYTLGHVAAAVADVPFGLALPAQRIGGQVYVDREFVSRLLLDPVSVQDGRVALGLRDIAGHWARPQILQLLQAGIVSGAGGGLFKPNDPLTRAAFVKMLVGARRLPLAPGDVGSLVDTGGHWVAAQGFIGAAVKAGLVVPGEYPGGRFLPDQAITREEMAVMITRALGRDAEARGRVVSVNGVGTAVVDGRSFTDAAFWSKPGYIAVAVEQGIITGYAAPDGATYSFGPHRQATRAEAVVMVVRTLAK